MLDPRSGALSTKALSLRRRFFVGTPSASTVPAAAGMRDVCFAEVGLELDTASGTEDEVSA